MNKDEVIRSVLIMVNTSGSHIEQKLLQCIQCLHQVTFVNTGPSF